MAERDLDQRRERIKALREEIAEAQVAWREYLARWSPKDNVVAFPGKPSEAATPLVELSKAP